MDNSIETFRQQIESMYHRLNRLYTDVDQSPTLATELTSLAWKELGIAAEELQVANEELLQQNDHIAETLHEAGIQRSYYQSLLEHIPAAYLVTTAEGKIQEASLLAAKLLRVLQPLLIGTLLIRFVPSAYRSLFRTELNRTRTLETGQSHTWSIWFEPRDASPIHLALTTSVSVHSDVYLDQPQVRVHWMLREMTETWTAIAPRQQMPQAVDAADWMCDRPIYTYDKGELIPLRPHTIWLVCEGLVKLHTLTEENEAILLGLLGPSTPFGMGSSFLSTYQATALTCVQLVQFSLAEVKAFPDLAQLLLSKLQQRSQQMEALLSIAGQRRVRGRLYHLLRLLRQEVGEPVENGVRLNLRLTHEDLANACCTSRVTITRLLGELQKQGKIAIARRCYIILTKQF